MKAISPIRSVRSCYEAVCCISEQSLTISRSKTPTEDPVAPLCDMNDCYSKLKELVPNRSSRGEFSERCSRHDPFIEVVRNRLQIFQRRWGSVPLEEASGIAFLTCDWLCLYFGLEGRLRRGAV
ncbi:hypothetical protein AALO_G00001490 [Alosa alosa]|uniref:Uncharacterized protein n=1 Tax=Alosa alosa TaxID=278164 RepID=A0AAV6HH89_9TELE|nr:hypothetical protein AALO_G00001490 [Alosa alosa]